MKRSLTGADLPVKRSSHVDLFPLVPFLPLGLAGEDLHPEISILRRRCIRGLFQYNYYILACFHRL
jgi:hypothetical protein